MSSRHDELRPLLPGRADPGLAAPPVELRVHAFLVLVAGFVLSFADDRQWGWTRLVVLACVLWPLLRGSIFAWCVQLLALPSAVWALYSVYRDATGSLTGLSTLVDGGVLLTAGLLLVIAIALLFAPRIRAYAREPAPPRNALFFGLAALMVASFPASALGVDSPIPHRRQLDEARRGTFLGSDPAGPVVFYGDVDGDLLCLITIEPDSTGSSCGQRTGLRRPGISRSNDLLEGLVPKRVTRVEVVSSTGRREAEVIQPDRFPANVYYLIDPPAFGTDLRLVGYDAAGKVVFDHRS